MTKRVGIFGYPLSHSISPAFQQAAFDFYSIPARYEPWSTPTNKLKEEIAKLRHEDYLGANVTVPHKEAVRAFLDEIDPWAKSIGAVNTIVRKDNKLVGYNTDAYGFIKSLKEMGDFNPGKKRVLLLGAGGAARAAAFGLAHEGVGTLFIANRTLSRAEALAEEFSAFDTEVTGIEMAGDMLRNAAAKADLIANSTSMGMLHSEAEGMTPLDADYIPASALVYDLVYNPESTPLLEAAKKAGARTLGGLPMLIYQGAAAFEHWTGKEAPIEIMFEAGKKALAAN